MTDKPHTPGTSEIRQEYTRDTDDWMLAGAEFDRWLAAHDEYKIREWTAKNDVVPHERYTRDIASAEQRGAVKALREAAESPDLIGHMYREYDDHPLRFTLAPAAVRATSNYLHNRADRIEGTTSDDND